MRFADKMKIFDLNVFSKLEEKRAELLRRGMHESYETVLEELIRRDELDMGREASPLRMAKDAVEVNCSDMTLEQVVQRVVELAREAMGEDA